MTHSVTWISPLTRLTWPWPPSCWRSSTRGLLARPAEDQPSVVRAAASRSTPSHPTPRLTAIVPVLGSARQDGATPARSRTPPKRPSRSPPAHPINGARGRDAAYVRERLCEQLRHRDHLDQPVEGHLGAVVLALRPAPDAPGHPHQRAPGLVPGAPTSAPSRRPRTPGAPPGRRERRTDTVQITERVALWYGSFRSRTVRVILVRDDKPRTRGRDDRGYGLPLVTTDLESSAEDLVARYASRWGIEQAFADARQIIGVGEARNRTRRAVERTVPFGLIGFSVVTLWYALHGHAPDDVPSPARARWYTTKTEPSYDDMAIKLRRVNIAARFRSSCPEQATPQETRTARGLGRRWHMIHKNCEDEPTVVPETSRNAVDPGAPPLLASRYHPPVSQRSGPERMRQSTPCSPMLSSRSSIVLCSTPASCVFFSSDRDPARPPPRIGYCALFSTGQVAM